MTKPITKYRMSKIKKIKRSQTKDVKKRILEQIKYSPKYNKDIDLLVADISLVITKRSEFNSLLKKNDYDLKIFNEILNNQNELSYNKLIK